MTAATDIAGRIKGRCKELGLPVSHLLKAVKLGPSFVKDLDQNPESSPGILNLLNICKELGVPIEWLVEGRGAEVEAAPGQYGYESVPAWRPRRISSELAGARIGEGTEVTVVDIPELDFRLSAGPGSLVAEDTVRRFWGLPRSYIESIGLDLRHTAFLEIVGDSMAPALLPGDLVLLDLRSKNPALPAIYALWDGDAMVCKRVEKVHGSDPPMVRIISENKAYTAYDVPAEWVNVIGRVAWFARRT